MKNRLSRKLNVIGTVTGGRLLDPATGAAIEWLEADGMGGFASGTANGIRTSRYHALLLVALDPPTNRRLLVSGLEEAIEIDGRLVPLSAQRYEDGTAHPRGWAHLHSFTIHPWPTWTFEIPTSSGETIRIMRELFVPHESASVVLTWRVEGRQQATLLARPLLRCRDCHILGKETPVAEPSLLDTGQGLSWRPFPGEPSVHAAYNGCYLHDPCWYRGFRYAEETRRGLDDTEDLWSPGTVSFDLTAEREARLILSSQSFATTNACDRIDRLKSAERKRRGPAPKTARDALRRSAEAYIVRRGRGKTIVAGYPWFTDWGRDTFISMRGLCLATERFDVARGILLEWSKHVDRGMLPNFFPDARPDGGSAAGAKDRRAWNGAGAAGKEAPHYNSVDASLWFVVTAAEYLQLTGNRDRSRLVPAMATILRGYRDGTRYGIGMDTDGLIRAGEEGSQLTWMDAKYGDECFSPRIGKPVEIQALWLNALRFMMTLAKSKKERSEWSALHEPGEASFRKRFWNPATKALFDVIDGPAGDDPTIRPNQLFAISLPADLLPIQKERAVVRTVEKKLLTPMGLRTLPPDHPGYHGQYEGGPYERDSAYHMGTVWPWLMGPFIEAWVKVHGGTAKARRQARKFLTHLEEHLDEGCLGHVTEVASGDAPHRAGGCPAQAWSVAEMLRVLLQVVG